MIFLDVLGASLTEKYGNKDTLFNQDGAEPRALIVMATSDTSFGMRVKLSKNTIVDFS